MKFVFRDSTLAYTRRVVHRPSPLIIERVRLFMQNGASSLSLSLSLCFLCSRSPNTLIGTFYGQTS